MTARAAALALLAAALGLTACDPSQDAASRAQARSSDAGFDPTAAQNVPDPARFGKPGPPAAEPAEAARPGPAFADLIAAVPAGSDDASPAALEAAAGKQASLFDGAQAGGGPAAFVPAAPARPIVRKGRMSIDTDGEIADRAAFRRVAARDRWRQNATSLRYADGRSLDPTRVPFIVVPLGFKGARLGDLAYVTYKGRGAWAVVGDYGRRGHFGEASSKLAQSLGIDPDGYSGGVSSGVTYTIFPGTAAAPARGESELTDFIRTRSAQLGAGQGRTRLASL